jgi:sec-independent protein translocase protein TatA
MGSFSIWHWLVVAVIILVLFGRGRISEMMGDFGKGISSFKKGMAETENEVKAEPARQISPPPATATPPAPPVADAVVVTPATDETKP